MAGVSQRTARRSVPPFTGAGVGVGTTAVAVDAAGCVVGVACGVAQAAATPLRTMRQVIATSVFKIYVSPFVVNERLDPRSFAIPKRGSGAPSKLNDGDAVISDPSVIVNTWRSRRCDQMTRCRCPVILSC